MTTQVIEGVAQTPGKKPLAYYHYKYHSAQVTYLCPMVPPVPLTAVSLGHLEILQQQAMQEQPLISYTVVVTVRPHVEAYASSASLVATAHVFSTRVEFEHWSGEYTADFDQDVWHHVADHFMLGIPNEEFVDWLGQYVAFNAHVPVYSRQAEPEPVVTEWDLL